MPRLLRRAAVPMSGAWVHPFGLVEIGMLAASELEGP